MKETKNQTNKEVTTKTDSWEREALYIFNKNTRDKNHTVLLLIESDKNMHL